MTVVSCVQLTAYLECQHFFVYILEYRNKEIISITDIFIVRYYWSIVLRLCSHRNEEGIHWRIELLTDAILSVDPVGIVHRIITGPISSDHNDNYISAVIPW